MEKLRKIPWLIKKSDQKEAITQFEVEDILCDIINKDNISQDQITKLNNLLAKKMSI